MVVVAVVIRLAVVLFGAAKAVAEVIPVNNPTVGTVVHVGDTVGAAALPLF